MSADNGSSDTNQDNLDQVRRTAEEIFGLRLGEVTRSGSERNMLGVQTERHVITQRLDSRTFFVTDVAFQPGRVETTFEGEDEDLLSAARAIVEGLGIP